MKRKSIFTVLLALFVSVANLNAETAYQKEVNKIVEKYYSLHTYGYVRNLSLSESMQLAFISPELLLLSIYYEEPNLAERMANELKQAEKLKTEEDFFREWKNSDHGNVSSLIKEKMGDKFEKDQFETQAQYQERVKGELKSAFMEWCVKAYADMEKTLEIKVSPKNYNAESQIYTLDVRETFTVFNKSFEHSFETSTKIQPQYARSFVETKLSSKDFSETKWYLVDNDIYAGVQVQFPSGLKLTIKKKEANVPLCFEFKKLQYNIPSLDNYKWCYTEANELYNYWDSELQKEVAKYNQAYVLNPFNVDKEQLNIHLNKQNRFDGKALKDEYNYKVRNLEYTVKTEKQNLKSRLRSRDVNRFIAIYEQQAPEDMNNAVRQMAEEYRCYNFTEQELKLAYIDNKKPASQTCKEKYIHLFKSDEDFLEFYSSNSFEEEIAKRQKMYSKYLEEDKFIDRCPQQKIKLKFQGCAEFSGDPFSPQGYAKRIANYINAKEIDILNPSYAEKLLEKCFLLDTNMSKEYEKNGSFFSKKRAFFESYTSSSYKNDLKNAKKSK